MVWASDVPPTWRPDTDPGPDLLFLLDYSPLMDWPVRSFLKASLAWLSLGVTLGVAMAVRPSWTVYRPAHEHMTLLGFVTMMIYGVAYHVIPRFAGRPLRHRWLAVWHWWAANVGLVLMVAGFALRVANGGDVSVAAGTAVLGVGGVFSAAGAYAFAFNIWRTIGGSAGGSRVPNAASESEAVAIIGLARRGVSLRVRRD
jgi:cbb3-type cytochrome oxidase subunit 1